MGCIKIYRARFDVLFSETIQKHPILQRQICDIRLKQQTIDFPSHLHTADFTCIHEMLLIMKIVSNHSFN